eukprot:1190874-Amphidinium_carterae.1
MAEDITGCPVHEAGTANVLSNGLFKPGWWAVAGSLRAVTKPETRAEGFSPALIQTVVVTLLLTLSLTSAWVAASSEP